MNHYTRWLELKKENPGKYARDIAGLMNISEAELTFARVGHDAWRLRGEVREILGALEAVGETKCICRNEYAVHEQVGTFTNQHLNGHAGLVLNPRALDLRLFAQYQRRRTRPLGCLDIALDFTVNSQPSGKTDVTLDPGPGTNQTVDASLHPALVLLPEHSFLLKLRHAPRLECITLENSRLH